MKVIAPRFFSAFHCIVDRCSDSCCIGWEIDVDPESEAFYRAQSGEIGNRLRAALEAGATMCISVWERTNAVRF